MRVQHEQGEVEADAVGVKVIEPAELLPEAVGSKLVARLQGFGQSPANAVPALDSGDGHLQEPGGLAGEVALPFNRG
jgi:hypothetical protein